jgi:SAM-dependent methyltransferase
VAEENESEVARREYATETGLAGRTALWSRRRGPGPPEVAFAEVMALSPGRVLDAGCGQGAFAARLLDAGVEVVALDQSKRMVELTAAHGVHAVVGEVEELPFADASFDVAVANYMLYHLPDLDRGLSELLRVLRPGGTLVAATNGRHQLAELWQLAGSPVSEGFHGFITENGEASLARHFSAVRRIDLSDELQLTADEMRDYVSHSIRRRNLAARIPDFGDRRAVTVSDCVFVATR